ncbi:MAG: hypothetical protein VR65_19900 [Desulfobulbaceae bacterium BRH_c16a]|nr:MAG: hypothetical protein VR65_19900 [Desulfobulbaceae bacterium BRH_c16a]
MLKIKEQLHYKRGYTDRCCSDCNHYVESFKLTGINGEDLGHGPRCGIIGLKPGRMYRINPKNICDKFDNSKLLTRLGADRWK